MRNTRTAIGLALIVAGVTLWFTNRPRAPHLDPPTILTQVRQLSQLATVRYTVQKVIGLKEQKQPLGSESILLIMQANVQAGLDLSTMGGGDVTRRADGVVVVRLPRARILNVSVDEKETRVWDRQKTWWTPWVPYSLDLETRARMAGLEAITKAALDMGILAEAERNATTSIRGLLGLTGLRNVIIVPGGVT